jgi:hypothetical protein
MSAWSDLVKKLCKENPGKPLGAILPLAKKIYRGSKKAETGTKKALKKMGKKGGKSQRRR